MSLMTLLTWQMLTWQSSRVTRIWRGRGQQQQQQMMMMDHLTLKALQHPCTGAW
jgi:hypothetical protein